MDLNILDLGFCEYNKALKIQHEILKEVQSGDDDTLILVEHPKVITMGRHANPSNMLMPPEKLELLGYSFENIERGGDATYHGPGQLVGYPIFNIKEHHNHSIKKFVKNLEEVFIQYLDKYHNLEGRRDSCNSGVFIENSKITAIGLAVKKGVTLHGFAFNVNTRLEDYDVIVPCGLADKGVTSLKKELKKEQDFQLVKSNILEVIKNIYGYDQLVYLSTKNYKGE